MDPRTLLSRSMEMEASLAQSSEVQTNRKCVLTCSTASSTEVSHLPSLKDKPRCQIRSITYRGLRGASEQVKITSGLLWVPKLLQQTIFTLYMCHSEPLSQSERIQPGSSQVPPNTSAVTPPSVHSGFPRRSVHRRSCSGYFFSIFILFLIMTSRNINKTGSTLILNHWGETVSRANSCRNLPGSGQIGLTG